MAQRTTITILAVAAGVVGLVLLACLGLLGLPFFVFTMRQAGRAAPAAPPAISNPGVSQGAEHFEKSVFLSDAGLGKVCDILFDAEREAPVAIAGTWGAVFADAAGKIQSRVVFSSPTSSVQFVDVEGDGTREYLNRGGQGWSNTSLLDSKGSLLWEYGGMPGLNDLAAGDLDGDGSLDFVAGFNGGGGIRRLDKDGKLVWRQSDGNVWHVEIVDTDGDGQAEIVHSNAGGQITIRGAEGNLLARAHPADYIAQFSLCRWPARDAKPCLLSAGDGHLWLFGFDGSTIADLTAPSAVRLGHARGTLVRLKADEPEYLAIALSFSNWDRSLLCIFNAQQKLVYEEVFADACEALAAVAGDHPGSEDLLVGGTGAVWKYSRKTAAADKSAPPAAERDEAAP